MVQAHASILVDSQTGNLAFKLVPIENNQVFADTQRFNYYTLIWVTKGSGSVRADLRDFDFSANTVLSFSLYQPFQMIGTSDMQGFILHFHPDFFCIYKHHKEVYCDGVLFNNIYGPPLLTIDESAANTLNMLIPQMEAGLKNPGLAQYELLVSYLKIFLITLSRLKLVQHPTAMPENNPQQEPFLLQNLKDCIETHYKEKHSATEYADMLSITPGALAKLTKKHYRKTLTDLIAERIIVEAKRELYLTNKTVKEIAYSLGYQDEYYFSRFFKKNTNVSPQVYRNTVGFNHAIAS